MFALMERRKVLPWQPCYQGRVGRTATPIVHDVEVDQPPDAVFGYLTDPTRFAEWQYHVLRVQLEGDAPLGEVPGSRRRGRSADRNAR